MKLSSVMCVLSVGLLMAQPAADPVATARKALDLMLAEKYSDVYQMCAPAMQKDIPEQQLAKIGAGYKAFGKVTQTGTPETRKAGMNTLVIIPVAFETQNVRFQIAVNNEGQIAVWVATPAGYAWQHPPYAKPDSFTEREVSFGDPNWKLPGTLTLPKGNGPFPAVVLVHDSGPNDRDETVYAIKPFKDLAEGLASRGIAVLRYEKRTRQYRARMTGRPGLTYADETVDDAVKAAAFLREQKEIDAKRVFVVGHGLGGYLAPRIAAADGKLAGVGILAGNARPLEDVILDERIASGSTGRPLEVVQGQVERIKALEPADRDSPPLLNLPVSYWLDLKGYDAVADAKQLPGKVLVLQGGRDYQVSMKDFELWKTGLAGRKETTLRDFPPLNHLFVAGEGKSSEAEYRKPGHVAPEVVDAIAQWILS